MICLVDLSETNFDMYAVKHYDNPHCTGMGEFQEDMQRFKYVRRLLNKYEETAELRENLLINHLVVLYNLFGVAATKMLFFRVDQKHWPVLVPFLIFLNRMPETVRMNSRDTIIGSDIQIDANVVDVLRKIMQCKPQ